MEENLLPDRDGSSSERAALELADLRMRVRRGFLLRLRALFVESDAESATAEAGKAHAAALEAHRRAEALVERRERVLTDDAQRAVGVLEGRLEEERGALERARERLWAFDAEHGVSSQPRRRVRDLSASERKRRGELRQSVRDAKQDLPDRPKPVPFDRLGAVYAEAEECSIDDLPRTRAGVLSELEQYLEPRSGDTS